MKRLSSYLAGNEVARQHKSLVPHRQINLIPLLLLFSLAFLPVCLHAQPAPVLAQGPDDTPTLVLDGGFENPDVAGFAQAPAGGAWSFTGPAGLSDNGTAITSANPNAPEGQQVAYISRASEINNAIDVPAGFYRFAFKGAQSGNNSAGNQVLQLRVDGQLVQSFTPAGTNYTQQTSKVVYLSSGAHSIALKGTSRNATALLDEFTQSWVRLKPMVQSVGPPYVQQLIFLFPNGQANTNLAIQGDGIYRLRFNATKTGGGNPKMQVKIAGTEVGEFTLGTGNNQFTTLPVYLATGGNTINFTNLSAANIQVKDIMVEHIGDWHDPYTWVGQQVPGPADFALVPADVSLALNETMAPEFLTSNGELLVPQNKDMTLTTKHVLVDGPGSLLEIGREETPYEMEATFTLNATIDDTLTFLLPMGSKFIAAKSGARWEMHGQPKHSWTQLSTTANVGDNSITLADPVNWEAGDSIVIASTDYDPYQAEVFEVQSVTGGGHVVQLNGNLAFMHYGAIDSFFNGVRWYEMDERAEVGLLSRNIVVQGDAASASSLYGAHCMSMLGAESHIENVEFFLAGQAGILGKYPFHWHKAQAAPGQYIKNASVHRSFNRAVTVHSTDSALVESVVGFDHFGHGFYLEAGDEEGNTFKDNLGLLTRVPQGFIPVEPHDSVPDEEGGVLFKLPATFWITNPSNNFIGNHAAGSDGAGIWMVALSQPLEGTTAGPPAFLPLGEFKDNCTHSGGWSNFSIDGGIDINTHEFINGTYAPKVNGQQVIPVIEQLTSYRSRRRGVWIRAHSLTFEDCAFSEMPIMTLFAFNQRLNNSLLLGQSHNVGNPLSPSEISVGRSLPRPDLPAFHGSNRIFGYNVYDGPSVYTKVHFAGFEYPNTWGMQPVGAATKSTVHRVSELSYDPLIPEDRKVRFFDKTTDDHIYSTGVIDLDGSLTGTAGTRITPRILDPMNPNRFWQVYEDGFNHEPGATFKPEWNAWFTGQEYYALHRMENSWHEANSASMYAYRSDGPALLTPSPKGKNNQNAVMVGSTYQYRWQYHRLPNKMRTFIRFCNPNDELVSRIENVPSTTLVNYIQGGNVTQANDLPDLLSSSSEKYLIKDNTLYIKHIAAQGGTDPQYGDLYSHYSRHINVCQNQGCTNGSGSTAFATLADFEIGSDDRFTTGGTYPISGLTFDAPMDPFAGGDNSMSWTIQTDGNGVDEYVEIKMALPRTVVSEWRTLQLNYSGGPMEVMVHDIDQGYYILDTVAPSTAVNIDMAPATDASNWVYFDQVDSIIFRIPESALGNLNAVHTANYEVNEMRWYDQVLAGGSKTASGSLEEAESHAATVFPNPSQGQFNLTQWFEKEDVLEIRVVDMQGRTVLLEQEQTPTGQWEHILDLAALGVPNGIYHLILTPQHGKAKTARLALQR